MQAKIIVSCMMDLTEEDEKLFKVVGPQSVMDTMRMRGENLDYAIEKPQVIEKISESIPQPIVRQISQKRGRKKR